MAPTDIAAALCDDLIEEILRLPCTACLAVVAAVCKRWERVVHDPTFRHRYSFAHHDNLAFIFRCYVADAHPPFKYDIIGTGAVDDGHRHNNLTLCSFLPGGGRKSTILHDCSNGRLLISSTCQAQFTVCDPVTSRAILLPATPVDIQSVEPSFIHAKLVTGGPADCLFSHVVCLIPHQGIFLYRAGSDCWDLLQDSGKPPSAGEPGICVMIPSTVWRMRSPHRWVEELHIHGTMFFRKQYSMSETHQKCLMDFKDGGVGIVSLKRDSDDGSPGNLMIRAYTDDSKEWVLQLHEFEGRGVEMEIIRVSGGIVYLSAQNDRINSLRGMLAVRLKTKQAVPVALSRWSDGMT